LAGDAQKDPPPVIGTSCVEQANNVESVDSVGPSPHPEPKSAAYEAAEAVPADRSTLSTFSTELTAGRPASHPVQAADRLASVEFCGRSYPCRIWSPKTGRIGDTFGFDTETTRIENHYTVPRYVIGTAFANGTAYIVGPEYLRQFWDAHSDCRAFMANAPFDLDVVAQQCEFDFRDMVEADRVLDVQVLYQLCEIGTAGKLPSQYSLAHLCEAVLNVTLPKSADVRTGFGRFLQDGAVAIGEIDGESLRYAATDAIATCQLGEQLEAKAREIAMHHGQAGLLTHNIQLRAAWAVQRITQRGVYVDVARATREHDHIENRKGQPLATLHAQGYVPGQAGNKAAYDKAIGAIEHRRGIRVPCTRDGHKSQREEHLAELTDEPFVGAFLEYQELHKTRAFLKTLKDSNGRIYPRFHVAVTGRIICHKPNLQQLPRAGGVRECIVARPGHVLVRPDYKFIELCCLGEICLQRYGESRLVDVINSGEDPHRMVAAMITDKRPDDVTSEERQRAKVANFGLPGGFGLQGFIRYAKTGYGLDLTEQEAAEWIEKWKQAFPEVSRYLDDGDDNLQLLARRFNLLDYPRVHGDGYIRRAAAVLLRVAGGHHETTKGRRFTVGEIDWAWRKIASQADSIGPKFADSIKDRHGSKDLQRVLTASRTAITLTGRVRANCTANEAKNTPFQSLAADGYRLALYELVMRRGHNIVLTVHDEILDEIADDEHLHARAQETTEVMIEQMRKVCPHVNIAVDSAAMYRWSKSAEAEYRDGVLVPSDEPPVLDAEPVPPLSEATASVRIDAQEEPIQSPAHTIPGVEPEQCEEGLAEAPAPETHVEAATSVANAVLQHLPGLELDQRRFSRARCLAGEIRAGRHYDVFYTELVGTLRTGNVTARALADDLQAMTGASWIKNTNRAEPRYNRMGEAVSMGTTQESDDEE